MYPLLAMYILSSVALVFVTQIAYQKQQAQL